MTRLRRRYLEHEVLTSFPQAHINLIRPSMSFLLIQTPDPLTIRDALPDLSRTTHIFLPINDNTNPAVAEGGSHWSLLLVSVVDGVAFSYDSMSGANEVEAQRTCEKIAKLLGRELKFLALRESPQQENGSDCGVLVCTIMEYLLVKKLLVADNDRKVSCIFEYLSTG